MKRRIGGLIGLALCVVLAYLIWENLSGGQGLMRNVWRNAALAALAPWVIYSLVLLFGSPKKQFSTHSRKPADSEECGKEWQQ
jgi:Na+/serine symporter